MSSAGSSLAASRYEAAPLTTSQATPLFAGTKSSGVPRPNVSVCFDQSSRIEQAGCTLFLIVSGARKVEQKYGTSSRTGREEFCLSSCDEGSMRRLG